jgi:predicted dinucleotide-binding enzyme
LSVDGRPNGSADRRALAIAGDDADAKRTVTDLLDSFGYDVVDAGSLADSWRFEPGHPAYGPTLTAPAMTESLAAASRTNG